MRKEGDERRHGDTRAIWNCGKMTKGLLLVRRDFEQSKDASS